MSKVFRIFFQLLGSLCASIAFPAAAQGNTSVDHFSQSNGTFDVISEAPHQIQIVENNRQAIAQRLELIRKACRSIQIEVFYFYPDESGQLILKALIEKKKENPHIQIQLHIDSWGSKGFSSQWIAFLQTHGIEVRKYLGSPLLGIGPTRKNHRKIWLVDQKWALIGGYNMGDEHFGYSPVFNMIDRDLLIEGPIVPSMTEAFLKIWNQSEKVLQLGKFSIPSFISKTNSSPRLEKLPVVQADRVRYLSDIDRDLQNNSWMKNQIDDVFKSAKQKIAIETKFFLPPLSTLFVLAQKLRSQVPVQIFSNSRAAAEPIDEELIFLSGAPLLGLGWIGADVRSFQGQLPGPQQAQNEQSALSRWGTHAKTFLIDDTVIIGSYNLDPISSYLNLEHAVMIESKEFAAAIENSIDAHTRTLARSHNPEVID